ncbi:hypothetical protein [Desulfoluna butyratoxydans]|uniref:DUF4875 domain-containing protein n=1 Tax=Desulfoluna butyratoxydans TaxID=231438 RepID=A0A4U8YKG8_9BACT|nr:hypothetical protein [Desulfoluna butyratoxydans]VFQ44366.1 hypothetical protein MSL71_20150 [Desulfoluna butyratoxydans]
MRRVLFAVISAVALALAMAGCSGNDVPDMSQAQVYEILDSESYPAPDDKGRYKIIIYSRDAKTFEQRAQTAIKAAVDFQKKKNAYEVIVWLEALPKVSERVAIAEYYPFKKSSWGNDKEYIWLVEGSGYEVRGSELNPMDILLNVYLHQ